MVIFGRLPAYKLALLSGLLLVAADIGSRSAFADDPPVDILKFAASRDPKQVAAAVKAIETAVEVTPEEAAIHGPEWGFALMNHGHPAEAARVADELLPLRPDDQKYYDDLMNVKGWGTIKAGRLGDGVHILTELVTHPPGRLDLAARWANMFDDPTYEAAATDADNGKPQFAEDLAKLCELGIPLKPENTTLVEKLQLRRVRMLIAAGQPCAADALLQARVLYNVCSMEQTSEAVGLMIQALRVSDPTGRLADTFQKEQLLGAQPLSVNSPSEVLAASPPPETVLHSIKIDPAPLAPAIAERIGTRYEALAGKGNLLLLAGRSAEARDAFLAARDLAVPKDAAAAIENIARALRADDGTIGRANGYLLSLAPR